LAERHSSLYDREAGGPPNFARFTFLHLDAAHNFYPDWGGAADTCVAILAVLDRDADSIQNRRAGSRP
jgi:hypothetical protein